MNGHTHPVTKDHRPQAVPVSSSRCLPGAGDGGARQGCWSLAGYGKRLLQTPLQQREHPQRSGRCHGQQPLASHSHPAGLVGSDHSGVSWSHLLTQAGSSQVLNKPLTMSISPTPDSQLPGAHSAHPGGHRSLLLPRGATTKQGNNHTQNSWHSWNPLDTTPLDHSLENTWSSSSTGSSKAVPTLPPARASQCHACPALGTGRQLQALTHESSSQER